MKITFSPDDNRAYYKRLVGKVYKILPICETNPETSVCYMDALIRELYGSMETLPYVSQRTKCISVINTLLNLRNMQYDPVIYRSDIFKCIRLINEVGETNEF